MIPKYLGRSLNYWLWEETHVSDDVWSNPSAGYYVDWSFFTFIFCQIVLILEKPQNKWKRGWRWPVAKISLYWFVIASFHKKSKEKRELIDGLSLRVFYRSQICNQIYAELIGLSIQHNDSILHQFSSKRMNANASISHTDEHLIKGSHYLDGHNVHITCTYLILFILIMKDSDTFKEN